MRRRIFVLLLFIVCTVTAGAQVFWPMKDDSLRKRVQLSGGAGQTFTLYTRLAAWINFNSGLQARLYCRFSDRWRANFEYTAVLGGGYEAWDNVRQRYYDVNLHYMFIRLNKNSLYYSIMGKNPPSFNLRKKNRYHKPVFLYTFAGFHADDLRATYTGDPLLQAHQISQQYTYPGTRMHFTWYGLNLGIGKEKRFRRFSLYNEFRVELNERLPNFTFSIGFRR